MPTLSMFYGVIIRMYTDEHVPPHIHAMYSGEKAVFNFDGDIVKGTFPKKQTRLVQAWIELHREELQANWDLAMNGEPLFKIKPLD